MNDIATLIQQIEATGQHRVLTRLTLRNSYGDAAGEREQIGVIADTETTGLDVSRDRIIELALLKFAFTPSGRVTRILGTYESYNDPGFPIPPESIEIHGITDAMVHGHRIDKQAVADFMQDVDLTIAHNAAFDRKILENDMPVFASMNWGCSQRQIPWNQMGYSSLKLEWLVFAAGLFYDSHRALTDCQALLHILATPCANGTVPLAALLNDMREPLLRLYAMRSPFEKKDQLRARRYRWNPDGQGPVPKTWSIDVKPSTVDSELQWLATHIYPAGAALSSLPQIVIHHKDRHSVRG